MRNSTKEWLADVILQAHGETIAITNNDWRGKRYRANGWVVFMVDELEQWLEALAGQDHIESVRAVIKAKAVLGGKIIDAFQIPGTSEKVADTGTGWRGA